jgi:hypothetical protein
MNILVKYQRLASLFTPACHAGAGSHDDYNGNVFLLGIYAVTRVSIAIGRGGD